jgi:hypothetical protein
MVLREIEKSDIFIGCLGERYGKSPGKKIPWP